MRKGPSSKAVRFGNMVYFVAAAHRLVDCLKASAISVHEALPAQLELALQRHRRRGKLFVRDSLKHNSLSVWPAHVRVKHLYAGGFVKSVAKVPI